MGRKSPIKYDAVNFELKIGDKSHGWFLIDKYRNFNLWKRKSGIRETFPLATKPNMFSVPTWGE